MKLSKDAKILKDLVAELEKGRIPADLAPVKALVTRAEVPSFMYIGDVYLKAMRRINRKCYLAGEAVLRTPEARRIRREHLKLMLSCDKVNLQVREAKTKILQELYWDAREGKLSVKQLNLKLKELCK